MSRQEIVDRTIADINPAYTRTPREALECTILRTLDAIDKEIEGDLVECGTWKGGCSFAMLLAQRYAYGEIRRPVWMYDSFEGMSPPSQRDGIQAALWWTGASPLPRDVPNENYCICPLPYALQAIDDLKLGGFALIRKGWLADTLPKFRPQQIAMLRVDCDWYEPVMCALSYLEPLVSPGGSIILDDYHAWLGCGEAVKDYRAAHGIDWPIHEIDGKNGAWMTKVLR
jgi:O-methyltransferase